MFNTHKIYSNINNSMIIYQFIMKCMYRINNITSYIINKIMYQSNTIHIDDIHNSEANKVIHYI